MKFGIQIEILQKFGKWDEKYLPKCKNAIKKENIKWWGELGKNLNGQKKVGTAMDGRLGERKDWKLVAV